MRSTVALLDKPASATAGVPCELALLHCAVKTISQLDELDAAIYVRLLHCQIGVADFQAPVDETHWQTPAVTEQLGARAVCVFKRQLRRVIGNTCRQTELVGVSALSGAQVHAKRFAEPG